MLSSSFRDIVEPLLNTVFDGDYGAAKPEWSKVFDVETALARKFEEVALIAGLGIAVEKGDGEGVTYDEGGEAYRVRMVHKVFNLAFRLTEELIEDGEHLSIGKIFTKHLVKGMLEAKEIFHANILSNCVNTSYVGGDHVTLLNAAHPRFDGATWSNKLATPADISEAAVEQIRLQIKQAQDERGRLISLKTRQLIVPSANFPNAIRLQKTVLRPNTSENTISVIADQNFIPEVVEMTRLTLPTMWLFQTDVEQGLVHKKRAALKKAMEGDFNTGDMRYKARERYSATWVDPRVVFGSEGV